MKVSGVFIENVFMVMRFDFSSPSYRPRRESKEVPRDEGSGPQVAVHLPVPFSLISLGLPELIELT